MYGPSGGNMFSPNFYGWNSAEISAGGALAYLNPASPNSFTDLTEISLSGSGLSITPNQGDPFNPTGPDVGTRIASGIVSSFGFISGTAASHGTISTSYQITGLNVQFQALIANSADVLVFLLSGNDEIRGSDYWDSMKGYAGDDLLLPGTTFAPSPLLADVVDGGAGNDTVSYANVSFSAVIDLSLGTARSALAAPRPVIYATLISIENAIGSQLSDVIKGNAAANVLSGGDGCQRPTPGQ